MSGRSEYPPVDARRISLLRATLLRDVAAMSPFWRGAAETEGPDRALIEAAARLSEEATQRLDQTPERDALAFLEMFDIAPPMPVAAEGVAVLALKPDQTRIVDVPDRTGVTIETLLGTTARFETSAPLRLQPTRINRLATVDPRTDRIEIAPTAVTTLEPDTRPHQTHRLLTAAAAGGTSIMLDPPIGIAEGDLLRVEAPGPVYVTVATFREDGLAELTEPLAQPLAAGMPIERMMRLAAFEMPDQQEHALLIGDIDVLNVKEPARVTLRFDPPSIGKLLVGQGAAFEVWGGREYPDGTVHLDWHPLVHFVSGDDDLIFYKAWTGALEPLEIGGLEHCWLRIRPRDAITPGADDEDHPLTAPEAQVDQITIGIETDTPELDGGDTTVSQLAYNGLPLSRAASFFPFGPEPQRFDTFAVAAPEAFTKPGATVSLDFKLLDATFMALTQAHRFDAQRHVYGIGRNGRLQSVDLGRAEPLWREFAGPPVGDGSDATHPLDPSFGIHAFGISIPDNADDAAEDRVIVRTLEGGMYSILISHRPALNSSDPEVLTRGEWTSIRDLPDGALAEEERPALALCPRKPTASAVHGFLYVATSQGLFFMWLRGNGTSVFGDWRPFNDQGTRPEFPVSPRFVAVEDPTQRDGQNVNDLTLPVCLAVDVNGAVHALSSTYVAGQWHPLVDGGTALTLLEAAMPAGRIYTRGPDGERRMSVAGITAAGLELWTFTDLLPSPDFIVSWRAAEELRLPATTALRLVDGLRPPGGFGFPHVIAFDHGPGGGALLQWVPDGMNPLIPNAPGLVARYQIPASQLPDETTPSLSLVAFDQRPGISQAQIVVPGSNQGILSVPVNMSYQLQLFDWFPAPEHPVEARQDDFTHLMALRETGGATEIHSGPDAADDVTVGTFDISDDETDVPIWRQFFSGADQGGDFTILRTLDAPFAATFDGTDSFELGAGNTQGWFADQTLLVVPDIGGAVLGPFQIASVSNGPATIVLAPDDAIEVAALMAANATTTLHIVFVVDRISSANLPIHRLSLAELPENVGIPDALGEFSAPETSSPIRLLTIDSGPNLAIVIGGWPASVAAGQHVKAFFTGNAEPVVTYNALAGAGTNPELSWEYFDGDGWRRLGAGEAFSDGTFDLAGSGVVSFVLPEDLAASEIGGQEDFWIRTRLVGGDFGRPIYRVEQTDLGGGNLTQEVVVVTDHMRPPEVATVTARFSLPPNHAPAAILARNNLRDLDQTAANLQAGTPFRMFVAAFEPYLVDAPDQPAAPGAPDRLARALMVGFEQPLETGLMTLFVVARDQDRRQTLQFSTLGADGAWSDVPIAGEDPTKGLNRTGLLTLSVTTRPAPVRLLGQTAHWLRIRAVGPNADDWAPQIEGMWPNGVPILQAQTILHEPLGSATGEPGQELQLLQSPVLPDSIDLRVRERLGSEEVSAIRSAFGDAAVLDDVPNLPGQWVRWRRVDSLVDQPGDARVFRADAAGTVTFGDGKNGKLALAGRDNLRAFRYRTGGERVETGAFAPASLAGSIEGFDRLLSPVAIAGGRDLPDRAALVARMPDVLRHAGQGLSLSDLEAMARDADGEIVQVRAIAPRATSDPVCVAVLARGQDRAPVYSLARRDALHAALMRRLSEAWPGACLKVVSVGFIELEVKVSLVAKPGQTASLQAQAKSVLDTFLHPALGGPWGQGWSPGRPLRPIDIRRALAPLEALDRVEIVTIVRADGGSPDAVDAAKVITTRRTRDITVLIAEAASP